MKKIISVILLSLICLDAFADGGPVYLPNLKANQTGTVNGGTKSADVNVTSAIITSETATTTEGGAPPADEKFVSGLYRAGNISKAIGLDVNGNVIIGQATVVQPTGSNLHTQVDSSALPAGAATAAKQPALGTAGTASLDVLTIQGGAGMTPVATDGSAVTQPVSAASLPLPSGAATAAKQDTGNTSVASIDTKTPALVSGRVPVDGSGVVQPVSGTLSTTAPVNVTGSGGTGSVSTVITLTAPANAVGFILQNLSTSATNIRFLAGGVATTTNGIQLLPGQDSGFIPIGANISVIAESGTNTYNYQWVAQ